MTVTPAPDSPPGTQGGGTGPSQLTGSATGIWCILVAAGRGTRFGGAKQYETIAGRRVVDHALEACTGAADGVVVVVSPGDRELVRAQVVVEGGRTRTESVRAGLRAVPTDARWVLVHDAARPAAGAELFSRVIGALRDGAPAVVPGVELADTVKRVRPHPRGVDGRWLVEETLDRDRLMAVQTPQGFDAGLLRRVHRGGGTGTDDAALVEEAGLPVVVVRGDRRNFKITTREDLEAMRASWGPSGG